MKNNVFHAAVIAAALFAAAAPALAQEGYYGSFFIRPHDRAVLRQFIVDEHARRCHENETCRIEPCGVASRVVVSYVPGSILPLSVADEVVPGRTARHLLAPPHNAAYVYADDNVYLIDVLSRRIIDNVGIGTE